MSDTDKPSLPRQLVKEISEIEWLEPWWCFYLDNPQLGPAFEDELRKELCNTHVLYPHRARAQAIAKRGDRDDVLFWLPGADQEFATTHLTWSPEGETNPRWPRTSLLTSLAEFSALEMGPANREWLSGSDPVR